MLQKSCVENTWAKKFPWVGLVMTKFTKIQTSLLKRTLFTWHLDLWRMEEGKTCNYSQTTWYHDSFAMNAKTYQMASCVIVWSLPCGHHNKWIAKDQWDECKLQRKHLTEGWGNPNKIQKTQKNIINDKWKISAIGQVINQASKYRLEREQMWVQ
jgi:hypothetical protein